MSVRKRRQPPVDPLLPFLGQLERLKVAGAITAYGSGPGPDEPWIGLSEATAARLGEYGSVLLDPGWWRQTTQAAGLGNLVVTIRSLDREEVPSRDPAAQLRMPRAPSSTSRSGTSSAGCWRGASRCS